MAEKKKTLLDKAVDALSSRDEKAAAAKAQQEAEAAKKETAELKVKMAAQQAAAAKAAAEKATADKAAAQKAAAERAAAAITAAEKAAAARAAASAPRVLKGKTTGNLKLRSGPGMDYEPPIAYLKPDTELEIVEELADWLKVKVEGKEGYVGKKYVNIQRTPGTPPPSTTGGGVS